MAHRIVLAGVAIGCALAAHPARAQDATADSAARSPARPVIKTNRWQEDWSALADPGQRTQPLDRLKYLPLGPQPDRFLTLGATLRERLEINHAAAFGIGAEDDTSLSQRLQTHADARLGPNWEAFVQLEDVRAFGKRQVGGADQNRLDLRLAFVAYQRETARGTFKARVGRQDFVFDLQRFVSSRDGPGVRQSFDAAWVDWESGPWRVLGFVSQPVQYADDHAFDDTSSGHFRFDVVRVERHVQGTNELSAYYGRYARSSARYSDRAGREDRDVFDLRYAGLAGALDWDLEAMVQRGWVGPARIRAWGLGARAGWTLADRPTTPRLGLQVDAASGDGQAGDGEVSTFNPLFPNGFYFTKAGYTGYVNLIHVKPSVTIKPTAKLVVQAAVAGQWRQTTADAIYTAPGGAVRGTAGRGGRWTGGYGQVHLDYAFDRNLTGLLEVVHYEVGDALRQAGGHDSDYVGVELKYGW